ncbi:MAG: dihydropteroate synthase [Bacteroidales bacterium]|nr:dihydropteroate synthase [Bacteroidales bacterium]
MENNSQTLASQAGSLRCRGRLISLEHPLVMGIVNVTEDSFYDGGLHFLPEDYLHHCERLLKEGADILDIGCMSTRPNAKGIPEEEEIRTATEAIKNIHKHFPDALLSIDTWRASVAEACADNGVDIINDVSGGDFDERMFSLVAQRQLPYIVMHTSGKPEVMQTLTDYEDVVQSVFRSLSQKVETLHRMQVKDVIVDPGFGFGKTRAQNFSLLKHFGVFRSLECPLLCALSRKSMLYQSINGGPEDALAATVAANLIALQQGANLLRVHDVKATKDAITIWEACRDAD